MDKIAEKYEDYEDIFNEFGKDYIQKKLSYLYQEMLDFINIRFCQEKVTVNVNVLTHAVMDYLTDISRLRKFHGLENVNDYKKKAYLSSWLLRRKPIQILDEEFEELVYINEKFVFSNILTFLTEDLNGNFDINLKDNNKKILDGYLESLYYYLKFRNCNPQALEMMLLSYRGGLASSNISFKSEI